MSVHNLCHLLEGWKGWTRHHIGCYSLKPSEMGCPNWNKILKSHSLCNRCCCFVTSSIRLHKESLLCKGDLNVRNANTMCHEKSTSCQPKLNQISARLQKNLVSRNQYKQTAKHINLKISAFRVFRVRVRVRPNSGRESKICIAQLY